MKRIRKLILGTVSSLALLTPVLATSCKPIWVVKEDYNKEKGCLKTFLKTINSKSDLEENEFRKFRINFRAFEKWANYWFLENTSKIDIVNQKNYNGRISISSIYRKEFEKWYEDIHNKVQDADSKYREFANEQTWKSLKENNADL